ncbi:hypothetical protein GCM10027277_17710 [Pseudoduganella ginsengisoli]|uniref:Uncharacterized protein n=1 Tax=Pseudoduganella ginsengisoli TaxID=1462440 RepID=A0A6L6PWE6_9BURK|nr:hypothetical protein [Pseudoduganella ginsengisoli]MTW00972.1 hypothetical protein [Pseudoduganella ginsengisoli]
MRLSLMTAALALALTACGGGGGGSSSTPNPAPTPPSITLASTSSQTLSGGKPVALSATVSSGDAVTWELAAGAPGSLSATSGNAVSYVPPASVTAITRVDIVAKAGGASKTVSVTLYPEPGAPGLSHIAGSLGGQGYVDGAGTAARFNAIADLAADSTGSLYVLEQSMLRKVSAAGVVTTLTMKDSGQAKVGALRAIAAGNNGAVLFIDSVGADTYYLRQLAADGSVTTLLQHPLLAGAKALVAGPNNTVYVMRDRSIVLAGTGTATVLAGDENDTSFSQADGQGSVARFATLAAMALDRDGNLLVAQDKSLRKVSPGGMVTTVLQTATGGTNNSETPLSLALDADNHPLVLVRAASPNTYAVRRLKLTGAVDVLFEGTYLGEQSDPTGQTIPKQLRVAGGKILLARRADIRQLQDNTAQPFAGLSQDSLTDIDGPGAAARFANPELLAADGAGNLYVSDYPDAYQEGPMLNRKGGLYLRKIAPDRTVTTLLVRKDFGEPGSIVADQAGNLYVSELAPWSGRIRNPGGAVYKVTPNGTLSLLAGQPVNAGSSSQPVDGPGAAARFIAPVLAGVDTGGNLYVRDAYQGASAIRKIAPDGTVTTIPALPAGVGAAPDGYTYTADNGAIYRTTASGNDVVAGVPGHFGTLLGALPGGLAAPTGNGSHQMITPTGPYSFAVISGSAILKLVLPH